MGHRRVLLPPPRASHAKPITLNWLLLTDSKGYGPPPGTTALLCAPSHATPTMLSEPRLTDNKECGPPLNTPALHRAPLLATPSALNEPCRRDDKEYGPPPGTSPPPRAIARHADHAQRAAPHGRQGVRATARHPPPPPRAIARHRPPRRPCSASRAAHTTRSAGHRRVLLPPAACIARHADCAQ